MDLQTKGLSENFLKSKGIKFRAMELLKNFMARSGVADKVTMVTRGDMEWPGKGVCDATHIA